MKNFSVIVPIYYGENYIPHIIHQIESCKQYLENEDNIEIIFVNDAPDAPLNVKWRSEIINIVVINTEYNVGIHGARLKGLMKSSGNYVLFLDQDDKIMPEYFKSQLKSIGNGDAVICRVIEAGEPYYSENNIFEHMICKNFIVGERNPIVSPGQALLKRQSIPNTWIENVMKYNGADDWFLWLCMIAEGCSMSLNQDILYEHVIRDCNASADLVSMRQSEQEVISIIQEKKIFSDEDFRLLLNGFFKMNAIRMKELDITHRHDCLLENWLNLRDRNINFSLFFQKYNYYTIAIYGAGKFGTHLFYELQNTDIEVAFGIDENSEYILYPAPVYSPKEQMTEVDAVVITIIDQYDKISKMLSEKIDVPMIPLEKIIEELILIGQINQDRD